MEPELPPEEDPPVEPPPMTTAPPPEVDEPPVEPGDTDPPELPPILTPPDVVPAGREAQRLEELVVVVDEPEDVEALDVDPEVEQSVELEELEELVPHIF